jgi:hypothetical protein
MKIQRLALTALMAILFTSVLSAQEATPRVNKRQRIQQQRIEQGAKSGALTKKETRRLEMREAKIQSDKVNAKADGKVTPAERRKLNRELNRSSRAIDRQKHDAQTR